jgi:hypothetical protein
MRGLLLYLELAKLAEVHCFLRCRPSCRLAKSSMPRDPRCLVSANVPTNHRASKGHADFERPALAHATTPARPLTPTHRIFALDRPSLFTVCSHCSRGVGRMRSAEVTDIALAVFAVVLTTALLIAFVSLH